MVPVFPPQSPLASTRLCKTPSAVVISHLCWIVGRKLGRFFQRRLCTTLASLQVCRTVNACTHYVYLYVLSVHGRRAQGIDMHKCRRAQPDTHFKADQGTQTNTYLRRPPQTPCHLRSRRWYLTWLSLESFLAGIMSVSGPWMYRGQKQSTTLPHCAPGRASSQQQAQCRLTKKLLFITFVSKAQNPGIKRFFTAH